MSDGIILVTGAAGGQQGSTGNWVSRFLLERGLAVRAFVHRIDKRSDELSALGAEVFEGDLRDIGSVRRATAGVTRAYFAYPVQAGLPEATTAFAIAAKDAGIEVVVNLDHLNTTEDAISPHTYRHWLSEQILNLAGVGATHLQGAVFFENLWAATAESVLRDGKINLPSGSGELPIPLVAGIDIARVAAAILADPVQHRGNAYPLVGEMLSLRQIASEFAAALNRPVEYVEISVERFRQVLARQNPDNPTAVTHLSVLWNQVLQDPLVGLKRAGKQVSVQDMLKVIPRITGAPAQTFQDFVRQRAIAGDR